MATAGKYFRKVYKGNKAHIDFKIQPLEGRITGDWNQLRFLLENLIDEACSVTLDGAVCLSARENCMVRNIWCASRLSATMTSLPDAGDAVSMPNRERKEVLQYILRYRKNEIWKTKNLK